MSPAGSSARWIRPAVGAIGLCSWLGNLAFFLVLDRHGANAPDPAAGLTAKLNNHGHVFFVEPWKARVFYGALVASMILFATNLTALNAAIREHRRGPILLVGVVTAVFWTVLAYSVSSPGR